MPRTSLGTLFVACQLADLVWPTLVLAGIERVEVEPGHTAFTPLNFVSYPYSHSLATLAVWSGLFGWVASRRAAADRLRTAALVTLVGVSHWVLDAVTHRPDMPLVPFAGPLVGWGLWNSVPGTLVVEAAMFSAGVFLYVRATRAVDRVGSIGLASLVAFLGSVYFINLLGPPPPNSVAVAGAAQAIWLLVLWAFWVDRHRRMRAVV
jgi:membrane-bound metal-dependent hydrolase YbcI (DUF457 family)